jgi:hypothetical protein
MPCTKEDPQTGVGWWPMKKKDKISWGSGLDVDWLTRLLADYDPEALVKIGAPRDEYSSEAELIIDAIRDKDWSLNSINNEVVRVFTKQFAPHPHINYAILGEVSLEILKKLESL